jgi:dynein heavy chain, axonemal
VSVLNRYAVEHASSFIIVVYAQSCCTNTQVDDGMQVYCVLSAIRERKKQFVFTDGSVVDLDDRVGFFITMNPGYAGRQELPENLKALFRGVTMMVPNRQIIMKVKLAACGYQENDIISKKFFVLYGLCEQQLSKQAHYDFGLRNILSVLRTGGASKRASPEKSEIFLMMRTLRDMNMSKFVAEDVPLFMSLIKDLFPGLEADRAQFPEVEEALEEQILERGLQVRITCSSISSVASLKHTLQL